MTKVLIIGYGFIGTHLTHSFGLRDDVVLTVFGRNGFEKKIPRVRYLRGEFSDSEELKKALAGQDIVYHLISQTIPASSWDSPTVELEKNLVPSVNLIELAAEAGIKKIAFASSAGTIYGLNRETLTETSPTTPFSPYGIIKRTIESFLEYSRVRYQINYDIYRISNVYGEGQNIRKGLGFINTALANIVLGRPVIVYGDGTNIRDYIYIEDVAKLLNLSLFKDCEDSDIYNLGSNHPVSLNELIGLIKEALNIDFEVVYLPARDSDNRQVVLDNSKIMNLLPETKLHSLRAGIRKTFSGIAENTAYSIKTKTSGQSF